MRMFDAQSDNQAWKVMNQHELVRGCKALPVLSNEAEVPFSARCIIAQADV